MRYRDTFRLQQEVLGLPKENHAVVELLKAGTCKSPISMIPFFICGGVGLVYVKIADNIWD